MPWFATIQYLRKKCWFKESTCRTCNFGAFLCRTERLFLCRTELRASSAILKLARNVHSKYQPCRAISQIYDAKCNTALRDLGVLKILTPKIYNYWGQWWVINPKATMISTQWVPLYFPHAWHLIQCEASTTLFHKLAAQPSCLEARHSKIACSGVHWPS